MKAALQDNELEDAGFHLAHVNHVLELINSIDPFGDVARRLDVQGAPLGRAGCPDPVWSLVEFAESPLSGLLPTGATESDVRKMLYAAWGATPQNRA